jgi:UDP-glucose 4-epimerase
MKILVIGGNGFIGTYLTDFLLNNGHQVRVFDKFHELYRAPNRKIEYFIDDIENNDVLLDAMNEIDVVFHLASSSVPSSSDVDVKKDLISNVVPTLLVLDNMIKKKVKKIVYFSSGGAIYGPSIDIPINEAQSLNPISSYGITKLTSEKYVELYSRNFEIDYLIIRPSNPYGPRQGKNIAHGVISTFIRKTLAREKLTVFGDGKNVKDYIYIKDLISCVYLLFSKNLNGTFNVGSGHGVSLLELIEEIQLITDVNNDLEFLPSNNYDVQNFILDISKLKDKIGVFNFVSLKTGILETFLWQKSLQE